MYFKEALPTVTILSSGVEDLYLYNNQSFAHMIKLETITFGTTSLDLFS
jgi:hypothetical protein